MQSQKLVAPTIALTVALTGPATLAGEREVLTAPEVEVQDQRSGYIVPYLRLSRFPEPVRDIPQTINIIPQELMQQQADFSLQDALRNVTGISFQAGEGVVPRVTICRYEGLTLVMTSFSTACATRDRIFGIPSISRPWRS